MTKEKIDSPPPPQVGASPRREETVTATKAYLVNEHIQGENPDWFRLLFPEEGRALQYALDLLRQFLEGSEASQPMSFTPTADPLEAPSGEVGLGEKGLPIAKVSLRPLDVVARWEMYPENGGMYRLEVVKVEVSQDDYGRYHEAALDFSSRYRSWYGG